VTNDESFDDLKKWISIVEGKEAPVPGFVVANKIDVADDPTDAAKQIAFAMGKGFG
jgi:hypothetical protein